MMNARQQIHSHLNATASVIQNLAEADLTPIARAAEMMSLALHHGHKILVFGNGGSAADAQHLAAELVGRFRKERAALPAIALTADTSLLTAVGNDYGFDQVFARQVEALAQRDDIAFGITTSGMSPNVIAGLQAANHRSAHTVALVGLRIEGAAAVADHTIYVPSRDTAHIQEAHNVIIHILCGLIEDSLYPEDDETV